MAYLGDDVAIDCVFFFFCVFFTVLFEVLHWASYVFSGKV